MYNVKAKNFGGPLDNQTWQMEWKTAPFHSVMRVQKNKLLKFCCVLQEHKVYCQRLHMVVKMANLLCLFTSNVADIHDVLDITVYDEDKRGAPEFLGRVIIPLLHVSCYCVG